MKANTGFIVAFITVASDEEAAAISKSLVESRLAACVSRVDDLRSLYWWRGAVESAHESLLIAKTRAALLPRIIQAVKASHSYTVPE
ncbi:MAG: divalent-cation tolerance protein CutA, partial [Chloroflexi bacterium]|nr:divalent-cation tolerance protein CutA [Chloroflexota bacterium]